MAWTMSYLQKTSPDMNLAKIDGSRVAILGAGNMGTSLAHLFAGNGHHVNLWTIDEATLNEIIDSNCNSKYLPGVSLHKGIKPNV